MQNGEDVEMADTGAKEQASEQDMKDSEQEDQEEPDSPLTPVPDDTQSTPQLSVENEDEGGDKMDTT